MGEVGDVTSARACPRALILAAGVGRRLAAGDGPAVPKIMLEIGGRTLLSRHVAALHRCGIVDITLVIGYAAERLRAAAEALASRPPLSLLVNPDYREGSVVSLWTGRAVLRSGAPVLLMDADVLYDHRLLARLLDGSAEDRLLLDRAIEPGDEPVKLCIRDGRIVDFHKRPTAPHDWHGESVGFFRFSAATASELADRVDEYVAGGRRHMEYEEPIRDMIISARPDRFDFEDISGLPWTEIDFPEDIAKAAALASDLAA